MSKLVEINGKSQYLFFRGGTTNSTKKTDCYMHGSPPASAFINSPGGIAATGKGGEDADGGAASADEEGCVKALLKGVL